jgi:hypothetical protein
MTSFLIYSDLKPNIAMLVCLRIYIKDDNESEFIQILWFLCYANNFIGNIFRLQKNVDLKKLNLTFIWFNWHEVL